MLIYIAFQVCVASTGMCSQVVPPMPPVRTMSDCLIEGEQAAAQWQDDNRGWIVRRITCSPGQRPKVESET